MRRRLACLLVCLAGPLGAGVASASSRLFLSGPTGRGAFGSFGDADGTFTTTLGNGGVDFSFDARTQFFEFRMTFISADGNPPGPGVYDGVEDASAHPPDGHPRIYYVVTDDDVCYDFGGSFVVHELVLGPANEVLAFSADYTLACQGGATRVGAVRFRVGDSTCEGAGDGTPCDDGDACTAGDACRAGRCAGEDVVTAGCPASDPCHHPPACDPSGGTCAAPPLAAGTVCDDGDPRTIDDRCRDGACAGCAARACQRYGGRDLDGGCMYYPFGFDGASCDDDDPCTVGDQCTDGRCGGAAVRCDDDDPCTADSCDPATGGCAATPRDGCWTAVGPAVLRFAASGTVYGHHVSCGYACRTTETDALLFENDDRFRIPAALMEVCPTGAAVAFPDLVGRVRTLRGRRVLVPDDLHDLQAALRECTGQRGKLLGLRIGLRATADPAVLDGKTTFRVVVRNVLPVFATSVSHFFATLRTAAPPSSPALTPRAARLPVCALPVRVRCAVD